MDADGTNDGPRWLTDTEMATWLPLTRLLVLLPSSLDAELREDAGISHVYYQILAMLSEAPDRQLRMGQLARMTATSLSRLSHAVSSLESRGWVERCPSPDDRRGQVARLTETGLDTLRSAAPGHVAEVRRRVFDHLDEQETRQLATIVRRLTDQLTGQACPPRD